MTKNIDDNGWIDFENFCLKFMYQTDNWNIRMNIHAEQTNTQKKKTQ